MIYDLTERTKSDVTAQLELEIYIDWKKKKHCEEFVTL